MSGWIDAMNLLNTFVFLLLAAGHAELQVAILNRLYAKPISERVLDWSGRIHHLLVFGVPLAMIWFAGLRGPGLLVGGEWSELPTAWLVVFAACGVGTLGLVVSTIRWQLRRESRLVENRESKTFDVAESMDESSVGDGGYLRTIGLPGNEVFLIESNELTIRHPRLPHEWDGLTILHLSDLHFEGTVSKAWFRDVIQLAKLWKPDLVAFTGDLLDRQELVAWLPETLGQLEAPLGCHFVLGNHDWYHRPEETRRALTDLGWKDATTGAARLEAPSPPQDATLQSATSPGERAGVRGAENVSANPTPNIIITGDERPWMGNAPNFGNPTDSDFRLLLSHSPDSLPWAKNNGVDLMLAGHVHGGQIVLPIIGPVYSPSRFGVKYATGVFWEPPTLLHVSRGVGAKQPIRYNCRPEMTLLTLRTDSE